MMRRWTPAGTYQTWLVVMLIALAWLARSRARAQSTADELGFSDAPINSTSGTPAASDTVPPPDAAAAQRSSLRLSARALVQSAWRVERSGADQLGKLRQVLVPRLEYKHDFKRDALSFRAVASGRAEADFAYLLRPHAYDAPTMEIYGSRLIPGETLLGFEAPAFEFAFGTQIVNFGQGEVLSWLDVVNPRDLREPMFADLEELRLPVLMTRLGFTVERVHADLLLVHEPTFGLLPPPVGEFSPLRKLVLEDPTLGPILSSRELRYAHHPGRNPTQLSASQLHGRLTWSGSRVDLALQAASLLDAFGVPSLPRADAFTHKQIALPSYHPRYALVGQSGALTLGAWLLRWELGAEIQRPLVVRRTHTQLPDWSYERLQTLRAMVGVTYVPSTRTNLALEVLGTGVLDNPERRPQASHAPLFPVEATRDRAARESDLLQGARAAHLGTADDRPAGFQRLRGPRRAELRALRRCARVARLRPLSAQRSLRPILRLRSQRPDVRQPALGLRGELEAHLLKSPSRT
ncbi:MAG: hypothetical protein QM778_30985 [Myxococcales bacterium]